MLDTIQIEQYVERARLLFRSGFNCSQAVYAACAPLYGISEDLALRIAASFGGGIGRMHSVCGAASGMFLLEGLQSGTNKQGDTQGKMYNYNQVRQLAQAFEQQHGSIICAELLGLTTHQTTQKTQKTPCAEIVENAVRIFLTQNADKW